MKGKNRLNFEAVCDPLFYTIQKGYDCLKSAGLYDPDDFGQKITINLVAALLSTKKVTIDFIDDIQSSDKTYFLRPRHIDENQIYGNSFGGVCVNWKNGGCGLSENELPFQCRKFVSKKDSDRKPIAGDIAMRWQPYQAIIKRAIPYYGLLKSFLSKFDKEEYEYQSAIEQLESRLKTVLIVIGSKKIKL